MHIPNFIFLALFEGEIGRNSTFLRSKRGRNPIFPLPIDLRELIFCYVIQILFSCRLAEKRVIFAFFDPSLPPSPNWVITEFWSQVIPTHIYLILNQTESIDRIGLILVSTQRSTNKYLTWLRIVFLVFWDPKTDSVDIPPPLIRHWSNYCNSRVVL